MNEQPASPNPADTPVVAPSSSFHEPVAPAANLPGALLAGLLAALAGAAAWALVTDITKYQIGWMAVGVGFLVGFAVRKFGRGTTPVFGAIGAVFALLGCLAGNLFAVVGMVAIENSVGFFEVLSKIPLSAMPEIMIESFSPMDVLFYGIAVFEGYKVAITPPKTA